MRNQESNIHWGVISFIGFIIIMTGLAIFLFVQSGNQSPTTYYTDGVPDQSSSSDLTDYQQCIENAKVQYDLDSSAAAEKETADVNACKAEYNQ